MKMLIRLAWKNVWRNPVRSGVVLAAVATGIWALMFILSFSNGMVNSYINSSIETRTSHLQIHHPEFVDDPEITYYLSDIASFEGNLYNLENVDQVAPRIITTGLISSATGSRGVQIMGIDPGKEAALTQLNTKIEEGNYLDADRRNPIILSRGMGRNLGIQLDHHVVLSFQGLEEDFVSGRFRVVGWYDSGNTRVDDMVAFVRLEDIGRIAGIEDGRFHEMAIRLNDIKQTEEVKDILSPLFPEALVRTYKEISPELAIYNEQIRTMLTIVIVVIMIALMFGIINTMLMAVLERQRELGMLLAIGMDRLKVFFLIMTESLILCIAAAPLGVFLGHITIQSLKDRGIDLSAWASGFQEFGLQPIIKPVLDYQTYWDIVFALVMTALLAGIYPALKAIRTKPVEALRKI